MEMRNASDVGPTRCKFPPSKQLLIVEFAAMPYVAVPGRKMQNVFIFTFSSQ